MSMPATIAEAAGLFRAKRLSPVELLRENLARIARLDPTLHAFVALDEAGAMRAAKAAEARFASGTPLGALDGIPVAHKDIIDVRGLPTTACSRMLQGNVAGADAPAAAGWARQGAVCLGKLTTHEFALGGPSFDLPTPPARNPWNPAHFTGGSSSGSGAAIAAGLLLGATGTDTLGSIRSPAHFCGIAGHKPTYGLVSRRGVFPLAFSLDHVGPMARTAEDCALLLQAMAGHDSQDPGSADRPVADFCGGLGAGAKGLRIGLVRHFHEADTPASDGVRANLAAAVAQLRRLGAEVTEVTLSPLVEYHAAALTIMMAEAQAIHGPWMRTRFMEYGEAFRMRVAMGAAVTGEDVVNAQRRRRELCGELAAAFRDHDLLLTCSQPTEAPRIEDASYFVSLKSWSFTAPANLAGLPAISVCSGFGEGGLPTGLQLIGRPFEDALVLRAAHAYEQAAGWTARMPPLA
jgi:aspartyl-tRNA(Asn)/glutamyl-tRNA(Gln) amidotransferase subunit A